jgi:hypothetical protein
MRLKLRIRRGQLAADLNVQGIIARDPALCAGLTPSTDLWTLLTIDDGFDPPLPVQGAASRATATANSWLCPVGELRWSNERAGCSPQAAAKIAA